LLKHKNIVFPGDFGLSSDQNEQANLKSHRINVELFFAKQILPQKEEIDEIFLKF